MSTILSPIKEVGKLQIEPIPTNKVLRNIKMCRVDGVIVIADDKGNVYSNQVRAGCAYTFNSGLEATLKGAARLGMLSKEALKEHQNMVITKRVKEEREYAAKAIEHQAKVLGIKLTNAQIGSIERAKLANDADKARLILSGFAR